MKKHKIWNFYTGFTRKEFGLFCNRLLRFFNWPRQDCNFEQQNVYGAAIKRLEVPDVLEKGIIVLRQIDMSRVRSKDITFDSPVCAGLLPL